MGKRKRRRSEDVRRKIKRLKQSLVRRYSDSDDEVSDYDHSAVDYSDYEEESRVSASDCSDTERVKSVVSTVEASTVTETVQSKPQTTEPSPSTSAAVPDVSVDIPAQILEALGGSKEKEEIYGPKIPEEISKRWGRIIVEGLGKEQKQELTEKFLIPENFKTLKAPKLNAEIAAVLSDSSRQRDKRMEKAQNMLGLAIAGLSKLTASLISSEVEKLSVIKQIADISQLLSDLHAENTNSRRKLILPSLDKKFTSMIQDVNRDSYLFGENLGEKIKASKSAEKSGLQIKRSYTAAPSTSKKYASRQGNWKGPPRQQGSRSTKQGGPKNRAPPQPPRRTTSDRYQPPPSKTNSRPQRKQQ